MSLIVMAFFAVKAFKSYLFVFVFSFHYQEMGQKICCDLCPKVFGLCLPLRVCYLVCIQILFQPTFVVW